MNFENDFFTLSLSDDWEHVYSDDPEQWLFQAARGALTVSFVPMRITEENQERVVDKLLEDAAVENDVAKRKKLFKDFQDTVARDVPDLNLYQPEFITIANQRVHDHSLTADGVESNLADVWVEPKK